MSSHQSSDLRFAALDYEAFRRLATAPGLSPNERIGFPDSYRGGKDEVIWADVVSKVPPLVERRGLRVLDIGPGCAALPRVIAQTCREQSHTLVFIDSPEMLAQLEDLPEVEKHGGFFPRDFREWADTAAGSFDAIVSYSVAHYVFLDGSLFDFVDAALQLLAPGGSFLLGDLPNVSMRKRFFASDAGKAFHHAFMNTTEDPEVRFNQLERGSLDDAVLQSLQARARAAGFDAWILPQRADLPMANRREDLLFRRP
jgi:hypothetical protein